MNLSDIEEALRRFDRDIGEIHEVFDERPAGYESIVKEKFRSLKEELEDARALSHSDTRHTTDEMLAYYDPAINEAWLELSTRSDSPPSPKMLEELSAASCKLKYFLLELGKRESA